MNMQNFKDAYLQLEAEMRDFAKNNGEIYLPNIVPKEPVDYIFICMEPSLGEWAKSSDDAKNKLKAGFRNFLDGFNTMILHYAIRNFLCKKNEGYHITDISKGAMLVRDAEVNRSKRYSKWYSLLLKEMNLVASTNVRVFAVGAKVANFLNNQNFSWATTPIIHYSGNAAKHWDRAISKHYDDFQLFQNKVTHEDFLENARDVIESSGVPSQISERALGRLQRGNLTISRLKLMFYYKLVFCDKL